MNQPDKVQPNQPALDFELMNKIDVAGTEFEANWGAENATQIADCLGGWAEPERAKLLEELIILDIELRRQAKLPVIMQDYLDQFKEDHALIETIFSSVAPEDCVNLQQFVARLRSSDLIGSKSIDASLTSLGNSQIDTVETVNRLKDTLLSTGELTEYQLELLTSREPSVPLVLGDYVIVDHIGQGGMGQVLKAVHRRMKREVALKILPADVSNSPSRVARFEREVQAAAKLIHPNIVTSYDAGFDKTRIT